MKYLMLTLLLTVFAGRAQAQCSDAGACAIGHEEEINTLDFGLSYSYGYSGKDDGISYNAIQLAAHAQILPGSQLTVLFPYASNSGPDGTASGIGDLTVLWQQTVWSDDDSQFRLQAGGKFATGMVNEGGLPQKYQPGLGSNDLLFGASYATTSWLFAAGYQLAGGRNENEATRLQRGDDVIGRVRYLTQAGPVELNGEVLAIKRLGESSVIDPSGPSFVDVPDSDQFQVNLVGYGSMPVSESVDVTLMAAIPLLKREINVDGLTRSAALSLGVNYAL